MSVENKKSEYVFTKANEWLSNNEYIENEIEFEDRDYLYTLLHYIDNWRKNIPITVLLTWDKKHNSIYCSVGTNKHFFTLDNSIHPSDFVYVMDEWCLEFYPKYVKDIIQEVELTTSEISEIREEKLRNNESFNFNEYFGKTKIIKYIEIGMIKSVYIIDDEFEIEINNELHRYISGTRLKPLGLSAFMKELKSLVTDEEKYEYIHNNSTFLFIDKQEKVEVIDYAGDRLTNFFKLHYKKLKDAAFVLDINKFIWGKYIIKIPNGLDHHDIEKIYDNLFI